MRFFFPSLEIPPKKKNSSSSYDFLLFGQTDALYEYDAGAHGVPGVFRARFCWLRGCGVLRAVRWRLVGGGGDLNALRDGEYPLVAAPRKDRLSLSSLLGCALHPGRYFLVGSFVLSIFCFAQSVAALAVCASSLKGQRHGSRGTASLSQESSLERLFAGEGAFVFRAKKRLERVLPHSEKTAKRRKRHSLDPSQKIPYRSRLSNIKTRDLS